MNLMQVVYRLGLCANIEETRVFCTKLSFFFFYGLQSILQDFLENFISFLSLPLCCGCRGRGDSNLGSTSYGVSSLSFNSQLSGLANCLGLDL